MALRSSGRFVRCTAPPGRHAGLPRRRDEAVAGQQPGAAHGGGAPQTTEVERGGRPRGPLPGGQLPAAHGPAGHRKDAPGPDHCGEAREQGEAVHLVSKTRCSAQNLGLGAQTADRWVRRYVRRGSAQKLDWLVVEEIAQLDMALWTDLACVGLNVKFLLLGSCRPCWTPGPGGPSARRWSTAS